MGDLWSIMEFLNPGLLGTQTDFKRCFFVPIQANRDAQAIERLKALTGPFILRRLKSDKTIIADLPEKMEMKVYCNLTREQGSLYAAVVEEAMETLTAADGIRRRGVVLATLSKLKQVCNHPAQFLGDNSAVPGRSGKLARLVEMLEEVLEAGERALVFTQFSEMGEIIKTHLQETFGEEVLFLHGGVPRAKRDRMVKRFQEAGASVFLLSLKAGGTGLNLTAANHRDLFLLFRLRGMERDGLVALLGLGGTTGDEETLVAEAQAAPADPLMTDLEAFWSGPNGYDEFLREVAVPEHPVPMASHLGGFPFWRGEKNVASSVSEINERAMRDGLRTFTGDWEIPADSE